MMATEARFKETEAGIIPEDWEVKELQRVAVFKNGKSSPIRRDSGKFPVYGSNGILGFTDTANSEENTIVIGRVGAYCGSVYFSKTRCWVTDNAIIALAKPANSPHFLFYLLRRLDLNNQRGGSSQPLINQSILNSLKSAFPVSLGEQVAIAKILSDLDSKIELRLMNKTLEAIGSAIFRHWFIDFEFPNEEGKPYRSSGGEMVHNEELGKEIPTGWHLRTINDAVTVKGGSTPSTKNAEYWDNGEMNWCTPRDLSRLDSPILLDTERKITEKGVATISSGVLPVGTVLLSSRAPIGYLAISEIPVAVNQGFIAILCDRGVSQYFMLFWLQNNMDKIESRAHGTTFEEVNKASFRNISIVVPSREVLRKFDELVHPLFRRAVENERSKRILSHLRDSLLPKLMSGKIRVPVEDG